MSEFNPPTMNVIDRLVNWLSPVRGAERYRARVQLEYMNSYLATRPSRFKRDRTDLGGSPDSHLDEPTRFELQETCLSLDRNNGLCKAVIDRSVDNILGPNGFQLYSKTSDIGLNDEIENDWWDWLGKSNSDPANRFHGWQRLKMLFRSDLVQGDGWIQCDDSTPRGQFRTFEAARVITPHRAKRADDMDIVNGTARDADGKLIWTFVANNFPTNPYVSESAGKWIRCDDPFRPVLQFIQPTREAYSRGEPIMTPVIRDVDDIEDLLLFNKMGEKLAAAFGFFVEGNSSSEFADSMLAPGESREKRLQNVTPGQIHYPNPGEKVYAVQHQRVGTQFKDFITLLIRYVGLPLGLPIELVLLDFSGVNFASSRQLLECARQKFRASQFDFCCYVSDLYKWWLRLQVRRGRYRDRPDILEHEWGLPGWPSPNPLQDAMAAKVGIEMRFNSRTRKAAAAGEDIEAILDELAKEELMLQERHLGTMAQKVAQGVKQNSGLDSVLSSAERQIYQQVINDLLAEINGTGGMAG